MLLSEAQKVEERAMWAREGRSVWYVAVGGEAGLNFLQNELRQ